MAMGDYRRCDVCGNKAFYDANLNYSYPDEPDPNEVVRGTSYTLDYLGDWTVICNDCSKTHRAVVIPVGPKSAWTKISDALPPEDETGEIFWLVRTRLREVLLCKQYRYGKSQYWMDQEGDLWAWDDVVEWAPIPE